MTIICMSQHFRHLHRAIISAYAKLFLCSMQQTALNNQHRSVTKPVQYGSQPALSQWYSVVALKNALATALDL